jgi:hypothetical protein
MDLLKKEHLKWLQEKGDDAIDFNDSLAGRIAEAADGLVISLFAGQLNKWLTPKVPDNVKEQLHDVFDNVIVSDYQKSLIELADVIEVIIENNEIEPNLKPWLLALIEIYKGVVEQLVFQSK